MAGAVLYGCGGLSEDDLASKERALPPECRGHRVDTKQAVEIAARLLPTVPVRIEFTAEIHKHNTRRDKVTGVTTIKLVDGAATTMALAHELAHAAVFDAYKNTAPPGAPSTEKAVAMHGTEFMTAYRGFMAQLVSDACASRL